MHTRNRLPTNTVLRELLLVGRGTDLSDAAALLTVVVTSDIEDSERLGRLDLSRWQKLAQASLQHEQADSGELNLIFVGEAAMAELNLQHMGGSGPTDVLAFPIDGLDVSGGASADGLPTLLGDVVICPAVAERNAHANGVSTEDELALLLVHGVLHVLGHDHVEPGETALMKSREQALLAANYLS